MLKTLSFFTGRTSYVKPIPTVSTSYVVPPPAVQPVSVAPAPPAATAEPLLPDYSVIRVHGDGLNVVEEDKVTTFFISHAGEKGQPDVRIEGRFYFIFILLTRVLVCHICYCVLVYHIYYCVLVYHIYYYLLAYHIYYCVLVYHIYYCVLVQPWFIFLGRHSVARCDVQAMDDDKYKVSYIPVETGLYNIHVKWNGRDLEGKEKCFVMIRHFVVIERRNYIL